MIMKKIYLGIICGLMFCGSVGAAALVDLSSETVVETFDTICWQSVYHFQGYDFPLPSCEGYNAVSYIDYVLECRDVDNCMLYRCNLAIAPIKHVVLEDTILLGDTLFFCGDTLMDAGVYKRSLVSNAGCDSVVQMTLHTRVGEVVVGGVTVSPVCADDGVLAMQVDLAGRVDTLQLVFAQDSMDNGLHDTNGWHDTIVPMIEDGYVTISFENLRAGVYNARVIGSFRTIKMFEKDVAVDVYYPSTIMEQRWDDVICVLTNSYNGGYDFVEYQWYKNGEALVGETGYYLNQPLEVGAEYSVRLTEEDGRQQMSCPLVVASKESEISVSPTLIKDRQSVRCYVLEDANVYV